ncbi:acyl--CoA ligase [Altererythrobacter sp. BO-6]|uniref:class I adenylate-forming enzyme family protein n=1 Tax=Altererythrobacter sp. BO-6 TaxID=2604537 RepID=UPI0013E11ADD|nr:class I adenylate-forming enzyme family protein [Altererythrobacter sp. BO-6]QIG54766.1 acyl--CoA ligase [Altererythrobacter sp. BO-6]
MYKVSLTESYFPAQADTEYRERTIASMLREQAESRGESLALRELLPDGSIGREWTYSQMLELAERCGRALASRHPKGARIAIMAGNCPEWVLLQMGAALAGLTLVTVNPAFTARELRYVLEQSSSIAIYYQPHVRGNALRPIVDEAAKGLPASDQVFDIELHNHVFAGEYDGELRETGPHDIVMIQYTSGTTGFPKGVLLHQHGLVQSNHDLMKRWNLNAGDVTMSPMPLFHTAGSAAAVLGTFSRGATLLLVTQFDPAVMVAAIVKHQPHSVGGVPTMIFGMVEAARAGGHKITGIKSVSSGGAMVAPELNRAAREIFGVPIVIVYGQTETSPAITATWPSDNDHDLTQTIGQPCPHMEVSIRNPSDNTVCAVGEQGEICMRGYNMMAGYNDNPEATAETVDADGWLHTGDLGTMDERGYVRITGRVKEMIIRGGENLFPAEIEAALLEHPAIAEVAVAGVPDEKWGEIVAAFVRLADVVEKPDDAELRAFIRERLSPQKTPAHWVWVSEFPLTGSGKIKKFAMAEAFANGEFS